MGDAVMSPIRVTSSIAGSKITATGEVVLVVKEKGRRRWCWHYRATSPCGARVPRGPSSGLTRSPAKP